MSTFVLIGGQFEIYDTEFQGDLHQSRCTLGAAFEMSDEDGKRAILAGAPILPKAMFDDLGFTEPEIKSYPNARLQDGAPAEFQHKLLNARIALHHHRESLAQEI